MGAAAAAGADCDGRARLQPPAQLERQARQERERVRELVATSRLDAALPVLAVAIGHHQLARKSRRLGANAQVYPRTGGQRGVVDMGSDVAGHRRLVGATAASRRREPERVRSCRARRARRRPHAGQRDRGRRYDVTAVPVMRGDHSVISFSVVSLS